MSDSSSFLHRSYRIGTTPVIPPKLYDDLDEDVRRYACYTLSALMNQIFGNYIENQSRIVRSICETFGKTLPAHSPNPKHHYGNYRQITNTSANIADSAHAYLAWSYSQFLTQIEKFRDFLSYVNNPSLKNVSHTWLATGYIPRWVATQLASRWHIKDWTWVTNIVRGWRNCIESHPLWPSSLGPRKLMHRISSHEWSQAGITLLEEFDAIISQRALQGFPTQKLVGLWRKIVRILRSGLDYLSVNNINGFSSNQKVHAIALQDHCGRGNFRSALGLLYAEVMIQKLGTTHISPLLQQLHSEAKNLLTSPFASEQRSQHLPAIILTSPKYILTRLNGAEMSTEIQAGHPVFFTLPRRPRTATSLLSSYQSLLTPTHQDRLRDEFPPLPEITKRKCANRGSPHGDRHSRTFLRRLLGLRLKRWLGIKISMHEHHWIQQFDPFWENPLKAHKLKLELKIHTKVLEKIKKGAKIDQILLHPPRTAAKHTVAVLQLSGNRMNLISVPRITTPAVLNSRVYVMGYDLNRLSDQAVTFGVLDKYGAEIPLKSSPLSNMKAVARINRSLRACDLTVSHLQQALHRYGSDAKRSGKLAFELRLLHRRRKNLKHEAEMIIAQDVYFQIHANSPQIVAYENLWGLSTRGKRGQLAKIVNYMYKRSDALATRIDEWYSVQSHAPSLVPVDPRNTSKIHFNCGGVIQRMIRSWDRAPCNRCGKIVNTQQNAPLRIAEKAFPS
jgi:hypothetical protein